MQIDLTDQVAVVTGASRGIGKAIAQGLAAAGARVVLASRRQEGVDQAAAEIEAAGGTTLAVAAHAGDEQAVGKLVEVTLETFGRIDIAVGNAGTNPHFGPTLQATTALWDKTMEVNLRGAFLLARAVAPAMQQQGGGRILFMSSIAGERPAMNLGIYAVSKAGLNMLTRVLALELGPFRIRVNAIAPGTIDTRFSQVLVSDPQVVEGILRRIPLGYVGQPQDVVGTALFLVSPLSDYLTGAVIPVDGGASAFGEVG
jgi:NAD(P)-dependent dehydrogenase (short-subunit alcohol dehydrogenase family)